MVNTEAPAKGKGEATKPAKQLKNCQCLSGTGKTCPEKTAKSFYRGHDAKMSSRVAQAIADGKMTPAEATKLIEGTGASELLVNKTLHSAKLRKEAKDRPPAEKKAKAAKPKDTASSTTPADKRLGTKQKVMHGERSFAGTVVRNASSDLKVRHRFQGKDCDHDLDEEA